MNNNKILISIKKYKEPISIEEYTNLCLFSKDGYYKKNNPIGKKGDFTTSPEISQLFGEIIGLYLLNNWMENINNNINLIELGPGRGTLINDMLKVTSQDNKFKDSIDLYLIEKNNELIIEQKLNFSKNKIDIDKITWLDDYVINNNKPVNIIANEFFDCFPIRQFYKKNNQYFEKMIIYNKDEKGLTLIDKEIADSIIIGKIDNQENNILEISTSRENYFKKICKHINTFGGIMIVIDYGFFKPIKNFTLQSAYNNKKSNLLDNIGMQDITSLVDFQLFVKIAKSFKLNINECCTQREFLLKYGIKKRSEKILINSNYSEKKLISEGLERIIDINDMGSLYKILVISK